MSLVPPKRSQARSELPRHAPTRMPASPARKRAAPAERKPAGRAADPSGAIRAEAERRGEEPAPGISLRGPCAEKTITVKEAAFRLGKSTDAVYKWLRTGRLRGLQPGGRCCAILVVEASVSEALLHSFQRAGAGRTMAAGPAACLR